MRILVNTQISSYDLDGNPLIDSDSSWNLTQGYANALAEAFPGKYDFLFIVPGRPFLAPTIGSDWEVWEDEHIPKDAFQARFDFGFATRNAAVYYKPDIIFECDPCKVLNWKYTCPGVPVVCYNSWIETPIYPKTKNYSLMWRQAEGSNFAEATLCNSLEAKRQIMHASQYSGTFLPEKSVHTVPPLVDERPWDHIRKFEGWPGETVKLMYNHRISEFKYYKDAWEAAIRMTNECATEHPDITFVLYVSNPSGKRLNPMQIDKPRNVRIVGQGDSLDRDAYTNRLHMMDIVLTTFQNDNGGCWSMSMAEAMLAGCGIIAPDHGGYKETVGPNFPHYHLTDLVNNRFSLMESNRIAREHYMRYYSSFETVRKLHDVLTKVHSGEIKCLDLPNTCLLYTSPSPRDS